MKVPIISCITVLLALLIVNGVFGQESSYCPEAIASFVPSDENLAKRGHWRIWIVPAIPEYGLSEGIVLRYKDWSVLRIGHEGISTFFYWDEGGPFEVDCRGRVKIQQIICPCE
jgi:hypothetical protein